MEKGPNWHKQVAIGTWILLGLGVYSYLRPPDPVHPMSLDFLSRAIAVPPWLAGAIILVAVWGTRAFLRWKDDRSAPIAPIVTDAATGIESDQLRKQISDLQTQNATLKLQAARGSSNKQSERFYGGGLPSEKLPDFDPSAQRVVLAWPEDLLVRIWRHSGTSNKGLLFELANLRSTWIGGFKLEITNATSWDQHHSQFRESKYFKAFQLANGKELGPASSTGGQWFLRTQDGKIILGNAQEPALPWPAEDSSVRQVWRLSLRLCLDEHHQPDNHLTMLKPLPPATLLISWDTSADIISMAQQC